MSLKKESEKMRFKVGKKVSGIEKHPHTAGKDVQKLKQIEKRTQSGRIEDKKGGSILTTKLHTSTSRGQTKSPFCRKKFDSLPASKRKVIYVIRVG